MLHGCRWLLRYIRQMRLTPSSPALTIAFSASDSLDTATPFTIPPCPLCSATGAPVLTSPRPQSPIRATGADEIRPRFGVRSDARHWFGVDQIRSDSTGVGIVHQSLAVRRSRDEHQPPPWRGGYQIDKE